MTHAQLAQEHDVSLNTVREAVSQLRGLGILEGRRNKGLVVGRFDPERLLPRNWPAMVKSEKEMLELARLRYILEVGAIDFAVRNATDEQIEQLEQITSELEELLQGQVRSKRGFELDLAFHCLILQMTQSPLIAEMQQVLAQFFELEAAKWGEQDIDNHQQEIWEHRTIADAIRVRDVEQARSMIRLHFRNNDLG